MTELISSNDILRGWEWYGRHKDHVLKMLTDGEVSMYAPSGGDIIHPELWTPSHWRWFVSEYGDTYLNHKRGT